MRDIPHLTAHDVLCVGLIVADFVGSPIPRLPRSGELIRTSGIELTIGGSAANVAVDLARLGIDVGLVGVVGDDYVGRFCKEVLQAQRVGCDHVVTSGTAQTSSTLIVNVSGEDRRFIHSVGANVELTGTEVPDQVLETARVLCLGGFSLNPALSGENVADLFRRARQYGVITVLDVVISDGPAAWEMLHAVLPETDVFMPNEDEGQAILGIDDPVEQARRFQQAGAQTVVVTRGGHGAVMLHANGLTRSSAFPVTQVDGTGGGDAFNAGFVYGLLTQAPLERCLIYGAAMGMSCVRGVGATTHVFTQPELEAFVTENALAIEALE